MKQNHYVDEVLNRLTMRDIIMQYTDKQPKKNRIPCPFHNGKDYNLSFNDQVFQCFVCGQKGNIFHFVANMFNLSFQQAVQKLQYDFNIGKPENDLRSRHKARAAEQDRLREIRKKEYLARAAIQEYERLETIWACYDQILQNYVPKTPEEEMHPHYIEALHNIKYYEYLLLLEEANRGAKFE